MGYVPPYTITEQMLNMTADIAEKIGRINGNSELKARPHLRRNNRILSVHSSLKIEANSLTFSEVKDVINGRTVIGNRQDIQEVKNAYEAYEEIENIDPYSIDDLKRLHGIMTRHTVEESGKFRSGNEGVFANGKCIFIAPPPDMVPGLMEELFDWMRKSRDNVHPVIAAAVFHYEFVFIHPFSDGNGRMARLWHTALLYRWRNVFEYIPIESRIEKFQEEYYNAISVCHKNGNSDVFIEFMLEKISEILDDFIKQISSSESAVTEYVKKLLGIMEYGVPYTASSLMETLGLKSRETFRKNYINPAISQGFVRQTIPEKPNSRNQRYVKI